MDFTFACYRLEPSSQFRFIVVWYRNLCLQVRAQLSDCDVTKAAKGKTVPGWQDYQNTTWRPLRKTLSIDIHACWWQESDVSTSYRPFSLSLLKDFAIIERCCPPFPSYSHNNLFISSVLILYESLITTMGPVRERCHYQSSHGAKEIRV